MKSICLALFSAVASVAHIWDSKIQGRMRSGEQALSMENSINLKVPMSPMGFFQNVNRMPSGQDLRGKKAPPFMTLNSSFLSFTTSVLANKRSLERYSFRAAISPIVFERKLFLILSYLLSTCYVFFTSDIAKWLVSGCLLPAKGVAGFFTRSIRTF